MSVSTIARHSKSCCYSANKILFCILKISIKAILQVPGTQKFSSETGMFFLGEKGWCGSILVGLRVTAVEPRTLKI